MYLDIAILFVPAVSTELSTRPIEISGKVNVVFRDCQSRTVHFANPLWLQRTGVIMGPDTFVEAALNNVQTRLSFPRVRFRLISRHQKIVYALLVKPKITRLSMIMIV